MTNKEPYRPPPRPPYQPPPLQPYQPPDDSPIPPELQGIILKLGEMIVHLANLHTKAKDARIYGNALFCILCCTDIDEIHEAARAAFAEAYADRPLSGPPPIPPDPPSPEKD